MKHILLAAALCLSATLAHAQNTTDLAKEYIDMPEVQASISDMFSPENMAAQMMASMPPGAAFSDQQMAALGQLMSDEMNALRPQLETLMETTVAELFSAEEISALITFYSSEHGASVMQKMSPMMQMVMAGMAPDMQAMQLRIQPQIMEILAPKQ